MNYPSADNCCEIMSDEHFLSLRDEWNRLLTQCSYPAPFCSWEWAWEWWHSFGKDVSPGYRLLVVQAYRADGCLIGLAPFFFPSQSAGPLRLRPLRPLGTRIHCLADDLTEEPLLLLHRDDPEGALQGLLAALLKWKGRGAWDLIHLRRMRRASDPAFRTIWNQIPARFPFVLTRPRQRDGQTRILPSAWPEFRRSLSRSMRDNIPYYPRLLTREEHAWAVRIARAPEEVAEAARVVVALHRARAYSERGPAHFDHMPTAAHQQFFVDVLTRLAANQMAAVALLEVSGVPVAAQSVLESGGRLTFYYSGFDPEWHRYSPITVLHTALIQEAIERGLTSLDYLPEAEPWKTRWGTQAEYIYDELSCLSLNPRSLFRNAWKTVTRLRSRRRGSECECGFCTPEEQKSGFPDNHSRQYLETIDDPQRR